MLISNKAQLAAATQSFAGVAATSVATELEQLSQGALPPFEQDHIKILQ